MNAVSLVRCNRENAAIVATLLLTAGSTLALETLPVGFGVGTSAGFSAEATIGGTTIGEVSGATFGASAGFVAISPANPPSGVLPPVAVAAGNDATVTALLSDDVQVVSATLNYRVGGTALFARVPMALTDAATGEWSATIPGADVSVRGVQYYVDASDGVNVASVPPVPAGLGIQVSGHPAFFLTPQTYALAGAPLRPANTDPTAVFAALGPYDPTVWRYGTFDPASSAYREPGAASPVLPGQGFWVISSDAATIAVSGTVADLSSPVSVTLRPGFNQIANPFAFAVDLADLGIPPGVDANLIGWNGTAYVNGVNTLQPNQGYWIYNDNPGNVTLTIPPLGAGVSSREAATPPGSPVGAEEGAWSVCVSARAGEFADHDNRFGMRESATGEKDAFDFADAPAPPHGFAVASWLESERALLTDWREPSEDGAAWTLEFRTDQVGQPFVIQFELDAELPVGWQLLAISEDGHDVVDLMETGALHGHVGATATRRLWTIAAGLPEFVDEARQEIRDDVDAAVRAFAFTPPFPNPMRGGRGTTFELRVPETTSARVDVYDVTGRHVATLLDGALVRGAHRVAWNGADAGGRRSASGVYFVQVRAGEFSRREKVVLVR